MYKNQQRRVDGFNIFIETIEKGLDNNLSHYFFGNEEDVTKKMIKNLEKNYPKINVVGYQCPPFGKVDKLLKDEYVENINKMNPDIIWISLGFPKQEEFIYEFKNNFPTTSNLVGIGAVFEWVAGTKIKAPEILANLGLEWIFRLAQEPKRLFRRYFVDNVLFIIYFVKQFIKR